MTPSSLLAPSRIGTPCGRRRQGSIRDSSNEAQSTPWRRHSPIALSVAGEASTSILGPTADNEGLRRAETSGRGNRAPGGSDASPHRRAHRGSGLASSGHRGCDRPEAAGCQPAAAVIDPGRPAPLAVVKPRPPQPRLVHRPGDAGTHHRVACRGRPARHSAAIPTRLVTADARSSPAAAREASRVQTRRFPLSGANVIWGCRAMGMRRPDWRQGDRDRGFDRAEDGEDRAFDRAVRQRSTGRLTRLLRCPSGRLGGERRLAPP